MNVWKRIGAGLLAATTLVWNLSFTVFASGENYVTGNDSYRLPVPQAYNSVKTINNIGTYEEEKIYFKDPQDLFIDDDDNLYIVDSGNNRIVKMNEELQTVGVFYGPDKAFGKPEGIFVDSDGDMYVADTGNKRIVHMAPDGSYVEEFTNPDSELTSQSAFSPSKLVVNSTGYIYVVRGENIMAIDGNGGFRGLYGQTNIGYNLTEALVRIFGSEKHKNALSKRLASSYINLTLGKDGMIYATSMERTEGELKQLNSVGTNVYRKYTTVGNSIRNPITDFIENKIMKAVVAGNSFKFGEYFDDEGGYMEPIFRDITVDDNGIITVIEELNGKVYQYDQEGNMLVAFGGLGESTGTFSRTSAIDVDSKGNLFILDRLNNNIQIFEPTEFITLVHQATAAYDAGDYDASYELWNKVLAIHENYELAHTGIAKTYYKKGMWKESMEESKLVNDRDVYTSAFDEYKYEVLRANFVWIILIALAIIIGAGVLLSKLNKASKNAYWTFLNEAGTMRIGQGLLYSVYVLLHPVDTIEGIRYNKERIRVAVPFIIFAAAYLVRIAYIYIVHFPLASIDVEDANMVFEAVKLFLVPITWIPASFAATSISDGESKFKEILFISALAMVPFIVINVPLMFLSNILSKSQQSWYGVFSALAYIGMFLILLQGMRILNNYTIGKTIRMMIISAAMMCVIWLVLGLFYVLSGRMIQFVFELIKEFRLNIL